MIEIIHSLNLVKGGLGMALGTILPKFIVMNIPVTVCTFSEAKAGKFLHLLPIDSLLLMTQEAINSDMFTTQSEPGFTVVKPGGWFKCLEIMA